MNQHLTLKIYRKLFFYLFSSNLQWLSSIMWLIINFISFNNLFNIFSDVYLKYDVYKNFSIFNYYLYFCFIDLIIISLFNMEFVFVYLPKINLIINHFKNVEHYSDITPKIFIKASMLIFASTIFYLLLPHLLWVLFTNKLTILNFSAYFIIVIFYIIFNVIAATSIEVIFSNTIGRLDPFASIFLINFLTLSLFVSFKTKTINNLFTNYIFLFISMAIITFYNYKYIMLKIDNYRPQSDEYKNKFNEIIQGKYVTIMVVVNIILKIIFMINSSMTM